MPDTTQTTDPVAAYLAEVQRDLGDGAPYPHRVMELHAPRLVAAVERVLELAEAWQAKAQGIAQQVPLDGASDVDIAMRLLVHDDHESHAKALCQIITRELLREGESANGS